MSNRTYDVKELQEVLKLSERTIFRLIKKGELTGFKAGREWRFTQTDIDAYIERQRRKFEQERREENAPQQDLPEAA